MQLVTFPFPSLVLLMTFLYDTFGDDDSVLDPERLPTTDVALLHKGDFFLQHFAP